MGAYILRRLLWAPVVLLAVSAITFFLGRFGPGDPIEVMLAQRVNPTVVERLRARYGLDKPVHEQYVIYLRDLVTGLDFGESYKFRGTPVMEVLLPRMIVSFQLGLVALVITFSIAIPVGIYAALRQGTPFDTAVIGVSLVVSSIPVYVSGPVMIILFSRVLHVLPPSGWGGLTDPRIIMPAIALSIGGIGTLARIMRASTLEITRQDYIRTARAKGLTDYVVVSRHMLRNAMLPVLTIVGLAMATLLEGAFITELLFGIPGMGNLAIESIFARDYPILMGIVLIIATSYVVANLLIDIAYTFLDPRIRYA